MYFPSRASNNLSMTMDIPIPNVSASGGTFTIPAVTATGTNYAYNTSGFPGRANHEYTTFFTACAVNGESVGYYSLSPGYLTLPSSSGWATKSWTQATSAMSVNTSDFFNSGNPTTRSLPITLIGGWWEIGTAVSHAIVDVGTAEGSATVTLNAAPYFNSTPSISKNTDGYYRGVTTVTVSSSATAQFGGYISSTKLTIGSQTTSISSNGSLSITLNELGTFTPNITITDSRGQTNSVNLSQITVTDEMPTTFNYTQPTSDKNGFWTSKSTASITVSNITVPYSGTATVKFNIGSQSVNRSDDGTLSIIPSTAGSFTPTIVVSDSFGRTYTQSLNPIVVNQYVAPNVNYQVYRAKNVTEGGVTKYGIKDEESTTHILIDASVTYIKDVGYLLEPTVKIDNITVSNITWYTTYSETDGLLNPVNWTNYNPNSPVKLYALISGTFLQARPYALGITAHDSAGGDSIEIMQTLSPAFFTIDFLAGGHGVSFGQMAKTEGAVFATDMPILLDLDVYNIDSQTGLAGGGEDKDFYNAIVKLGWASYIME